MPERRIQGLLVITLVAVACAGGDDVEGVRDAGERVRDGGVVARDGGPFAGDHRERCAMECADPGSDFDECAGADSELCGRYCREILTGFSEDCGACISERGQILYEDTTSCEWNGYLDHGFEACAPRCPLNRSPVSSEALEAKCDSFCVVYDRALPQPCNAETTRACRDRCASFFDGSSTACVACVLGSGLRPESFGNDLRSECYPERYSISDSCAAYCD